MAAKRRRIFGWLGALILLPLFLLIAAWWFSPTLIRSGAARALVPAGIEIIELETGRPGLKGLTMERAQIQGPGWQVSLENTFAFYSWTRLLREKTLEVIEFDRLDVTVEPAKLNGSDDPLTTAILDRIPSEVIRVKQGKVSVLLDAGTLEADWGGILSKNKETFNLQVNRLGLAFRDPAPNRVMHMPVLEDPDGVFSLNYQLDDAKLALRWNLNEIGLNRDALQANGLATAGGLAFTDPGLSGADLAAIRTWAPPLWEKAEGTASLSLNAFSRGAVTANWIQSELVFEPAQNQKESQSRLEATAGNVSVGPETLDQITVSLTNRGNPDKLHTSGEAGFWFDGVEGRLRLEQTAVRLMDEPSLQGEYTLEPMRFDYSDLPGRHLTGFRDLIFSGSLAAAGDYFLGPDGFDASGTLKLNAASASMPGSSLDVEGLTATVDINSIREMKSNPGETFVSMDTIHLGDLSLTNTRLQADILDRRSIQLNEGSTELFDGTVRLSPLTLQLNPVSFATSIVFDRLSLSAIVDNLQLFQGRMEGAVSGNLPITFEDGKFGTRGGHLTLSEGETARLFYDTEGLFAQQPAKEDKGFLQAIGDKFLEKLKLAPEEVVEDALSDLTIDELRIDLFPENSPDTPARIHLAGKGRSGKTVVPMVLDTNINGTTDELLQFLMRLHSVGTPSLE